MPPACPPTNLLLSLTREPSINILPFCTERNPYLSRILSNVLSIFLCFSIASISSNREYIVRLSSTKLSYLTAIERTAPPSYLLLKSSRT